VVFRRSYSRDGEDWWQVCRRVVEGMFTVLRVHCLSRNRPWDEERYRSVAADAYDRLWKLQWTPPGRGLWTMGTEFMYERGGAALNSCGFVSTADIGQDFAEPFVWMFETSMLGIGVGFDTRGVGSLRLQKPPVSDEPHQIEDSREGWATALRRLLTGYATGTPLPRRWDASNVRPEGAPLRSFGGTASGPAPLLTMLEDLRELYESYVGRSLDARLIVDTMNLIGRCVVAGGLRRSAQAAFGSPDDREFLELKSDPEALRTHRWVSNNSVFAEVGMDYTEIARHSALNGEPGYLWLDNARAYGRLVDAPNWLDAEAQGSNPCVEQTLWNHELCTLVETYPAQHRTYEEFAKTLRLALLYGKAVTLVATGMPRTDAIIERNRRIGCSMTGIIQAINRHGYRRFLSWCDRGYTMLREMDAEISDWLGVSQSIKLTSVKPSGSVSLLSGSTPGVHWDHAPYYLRRIRVRADAPLVGICSDAGFPVEADEYAPDTTVISFPVKVSHAGRSKRDVSIWEKIDLAAQMQRYWSDNQVSCTVDFDPVTEKQTLSRLLQAYEDRLKAVTFLPRSEHGYAQAPYEEISAEQYHSIADKLQPLSGSIAHERTMEQQFCEGHGCSLSPPPSKQS
jgi:adenosylcobalamin-dependent ribonucleoside-triphosphate reductase